MDFTLCTYTYNDGPMARRLLERAAGFPLRPAEAVVVDDGSREPFAAPDLPFPVRVLRHASNRGITETKRAGIEAARSPVIWSLDCDVLPAPDWMLACLPHLARPGVGLVGGRILPASGELTVDRYVRRFEPLERDAGEVAFIAGAAWLFTRQAWDRAGGFRDHPERVIEDHAFCLHLRERGYTLFLEERAVVRTTRRLSRMAMVKRFWKWVRPALKALLDRGGDPFTAFIEPMTARLRDCLLEGEPGFVYLELLYLSYAMLDARRLARDLGHGRAAAGLEAFWPDLCAALAGLNQVLAALARDLGRMGYPVRPEPGGGPGGTFLSGLRQVLDQDGVLDWLNTQGVALLDAEEARGEFDFSAYGEGL